MSKQMGIKSLEGQIEQNRELRELVRKQRLEIVQLKDECQTAKDEAAQATARAQQAETAIVVLSNLLSAAYTSFAQ